MVNCKGEALIKDFKFIANDLNLKTVKVSLSNLGLSYKAPPSTSSG